MPGATGEAAYAPHGGHRHGGSRGFRGGRGVGTTGEACMPTHTRRKCQRLTKAGQPCQNFAVKGSDFCWMHSLRSSNWPQALILLAAGGVLGFIGSWLVAWMGADVPFQIAHTQVPREVPRLSRFPFRVFEGNNSYDIPTAGTVANMSHGLSLRVTEDRSIFLSAEIRNETGAVVALLRDSRLFVSPGLPYDVNSDLTAFEVVDEHLRPVLQVYRRDAPERLQVNYYVVLSIDPLRVLVCHEGGCSGGLKAEGEEARHELKRMFKYPGYKYPGARL
jgi:hypothetical protein